MNPSSSPVRRVALTGGIGTGKSYVRGRLERAGVPTLDADILARDAVAPGTPGLSAVARRFGAAVLNSDGTLNRHALGVMVFGDPEARRDLEAIVHPAVRTAIDRWFSQLDSAAYTFAVADIPLLFETNRQGDFDAIILTTCSPETQLRRLLMREGMTESDAHQRIAAQLPVGEKITRASFVIDTDGTLAQTDAQVDAVVRDLAANYSPR